MEFTPEEKQRIYEEEKARLKAQEAVKAEQLQADFQKAGKGCAGCLVVGVLLVVIGAVIQQFEDARVRAPVTPRESGPAPSPGPSAGASVKQDTLKRWAEFLLLFDEPTADKQDSRLDQYIAQLEYVDDRVPEEPEQIANMVTRARQVLRGRGVTITNGELLRGSVKALEHGNFNQQYSTILATLMVLLENEKRDPKRR